MLLSPALTGGSGEEWKEPKANEKKNVNFGLDLGFGVWKIETWATISTSLNDPNNFLDPKNSTFLGPPQMEI